MLSGQKGTVICLLSFSALGRLRSLPDSPKSKSKFHVPFRFIHAVLSNCGRGYSGRGIPAAHNDKPLTRRIAVANNFLMSVII